MLRENFFSIRIAIHAMSASVFWFVLYDYQRTNHTHLYASRIVTGLRVPYERVCVLRRIHTIRTGENGQIK